MSEYKGKALKTGKGKGQVDRLFGAKDELLLEQLDFHRPDGTMALEILTMTDPRDGSVVERVTFVMGENGFTKRKVVSEIFWVETGKTEIHDIESGATERALYHFRLTETQIRVFNEKGEQVDAPRDA